MTVYPILAKLHSIGALDSAHMSTQHLPCGESFHGWLVDNVVLLQTLAEAVEFPADVPENTMRAFQQAL